MFNRLSTLILLLIVISISSSSLYGQNAPQRSFIQIIAEGTLDEVLQKINDTPDINAKINELGWTPLHAAVSFRNGDLATMLVEELDADVDAKDNSGNTPLMIAIETGQVNAVSFLIDNGANVNIANNNGDMPLSIAQKIGLGSIVNILMENDADVPGEAQRGRGNRVGLPSMSFNMPEGIMNRRGPGQNQINQDQPGTEENVNIDFVPSIDSVVTGDLDSNEVQERIKKYPGLTEAVLEIVDGSRSELREWGRVENDNRIRLISAIRKQYQSEMQFVQKIAKEENAAKTIELAKSLDESRKDTFVSINRVVRDQGTNSSRTSTSTRRTASRTTTATRVNRRGSSTQVETIVQEEESKYPPEVQAEIDVWLSSDITALNGRISLMDSVNEKIVSEINSLKQTANGEKAEKTIAAIDGLLIARQIEYDKLKKELQDDEQEQYMSVPEEITDDETLINQRGMNRGQMAPTGRGARGR